MIHFKCRLNQRFWRSKKVVQVVQIGGRLAGGEGNLDKIQKNSSFFRPLIGAKFYWTIFCKNILTQFLTEKNDQTCRLVFDGLPNFLAYVPDFNYTSNSPGDR